MSEDCHESGNWFTCRSCGKRTNLGVYCRECNAMIDSEGEDDEPLNYCEGCNGPKDPKAPRVYCQTCLDMLAAVMAQPGLKQAHYDWEKENQRRIAHKRALMKGE